MTDIRPISTTRVTVQQAATIQGDTSPMSGLSHQAQQDTLPPHQQLDTKLDKPEPELTESPTIPPRQQVITLPAPMRIRSNIQLPRIPSGLSLTFRQESLRGNRVLQIPSSQEIQLPEINRVLSRLELPPEQESFVIPVEDLDEVVEHAAEHDEDRQIPVGVEVQQQGEQADAEQGPEAAHNQAAEADDANVRKTATWRVVLQFLFNVVVLVAYILGDRFINNAISVLVLFIVFLVFAVVYIALLILTKDLTSKPNPTRLFLSIGNVLALIVYIVIGYLKAQYDTDIPLTPFTILGFFCVFSNCCQNSTEPTAPTQTFILLQKLILWVELFLIGLRADGMNLPWGTVFIPIYVALIILIFSSILIFFGSTFAFFSVLKEEGASMKLISGTLWYVLNTIYPGVWLALIAKLIGYLENGDMGVITVLRVGIIHSGILFLFTIVFWKQLYEFQKFEIQSEMISQVELEDNEIQGAARQNQRVTFRVSKENRTNLIMISPTFYAFLKKHLKHKDTKAIEKLKQEIEQAKLQKYRHNLTMKVPYRSADPAPVTNKLVSIVAVKAERNRNLDLSEGDIDIKRQIPSIAAMKREASNQASEQLCAICYDKVPNAVFMDCGHGGVCYECALENWKKTDDCIMCRKKINKVLKIVHFKPLKVIKVVESTKKVVA